MAPEDSRIGRAFMPFLPLALFCIQHDLFSLGLALPVIATDEALRPRILGLLFGVANIGTAIGPRGGRRPCGRCGLAMGVPRERPDRPGGMRHRRALVDSRDPGGRTIRQVDRLGLALIVVGVATLSLGIDAITGYGLIAVVTVTMLVMSAAAGLGVHTPSRSSPARRDGFPWAASHGTVPLMPRLLGPDPALPVVFTLQRARAAGLSVDQVRHRVDSGRWVRLARDTYRRADWLPAGCDRFAEIRLDHVHRAVAAVRRNPGSVIGFESATTGHGLPLISRVPDVVTLIVPPGAWTGTRHGIRFRQAVLTPQDVADGGVPMTSPDRTWADIARTASLADALASGDAGLRTGALDLARLTEVVAGSRGSRGCRRAALALDHLDPARETPLESESWAYFLRYRIPLPEVQVELRAGGGRFIARVDFWWKRARLVGECDGRLKYATADDVYAEKRREDEIRAEGCGVIRWGAADLRGPQLAQRLLRALA